ncbi:HEAT repeat-containing protein 3 [Leptidea sinapis]|uniref:HEAT repeat-containing protein 3 n=1 Tax=Leptidea sinapis TaxID=189913 RepID=UPI00212B7F0A|nr:HEAT repeat-containing protein 3 [Leptidea sinapis]
MGKIRKRKPKRNSNLDTVENFEEEICVDSRETSIQTIIDQLQAVNVEEKYCALQSFAMLIENEQNVEQAVSRGLIKIIAPLLLDPASCIRNASAGSLRNLSSLGMSICETLMEHDIMTPLICYFHQFTETWTPDGSLKSKDEEIDTFIQCVNLLLNVCESSELAVKYLMESKVLDILPRYLDLKTFGSDIVIAVLQCLFVVLEDNSAASAKLQSSIENQLREFLSLHGDESSTLLIRTLASGVTINMCAGIITSLPITVVHQIMEILANTLSIDHRNACDKLSNLVPLQNESGKTIPPKGKEAQELECHIKTVLQLLDSQQSAIEILANICASDDGDDEDVESSDGEELGNDEISDGIGGTVHPEDRLPPEVLEAIISLQLFEKVWAKAQLPAVNVTMVLEEYNDSALVVKKLKNVQTKALLGVNNMLLTLPVDKLGGIDGIYKIWVDCGKLVFKDNVKNNIFLESATAVMRTALDKIKFRGNGNIQNSSIFNNMALSDIEIMLNGIKECEVPEIRSNLIRMIGILGLLLVNNINETTANVIIVITEFILEQAHKENEVWVLAEAIDTIVDLYSEDETNEIAAKVKLADKLSILSPILKNKARQQKKLPKEYKVLVSTTCSNLPRFIKYIKELS